MEHFLSLMIEMIIDVLNLTQENFEVGLQLLFHPEVQWQEQPRQVVINFDPKAKLEKMIQDGTIKVQSVSEAKQNKVEEIYDMVDKIYQRSETKDRGGSHESNTVTIDLSQDDSDSDRDMTAIVLEEPVCKSDTENKTPHKAKMRKITTFDSSDEDEHDAVRDGEQIGV